MTEEYQSPPFEKKMRMKLSLNSELQWPKSESVEVTKRPLSSKQLDVQRKLLHKQSSHAHLYDIKRDKAHKLLAF